MNFGRDGLLETKVLLESGGIGYFGDPDVSESERVARVTIGGVHFSFVNWSDWTSDKTDHTVAQVRAEAREGRVVVVYTHWGDEYAPEPPERVRALARTFIDAGAAIIIGSHPHVVQRPEMYRGKYIYYSLGNFFFDQYWSDAVRTGLLLRVSFAPGVVSIEEIPVVMERTRQTCPIAS